MSSDKIKVGLLYNFINFTQWPDSPQQSNARTYNICIASDGSYPGIFNILTKKIIRGRKLEVTALSKRANEKSIDQCQLILLRYQSEKAQQQLIEKLNNKPILTIADGTLSNRSEAMINFVSGKKNIAFIINRKKASESGIQFSSKMLRLALKVIDSDEAGLIIKFSSSVAIIASNIQTSPTTNQLKLKSSGGLS